MQCQALYAWHCAEDQGNAKMRRKMRRMVCGDLRYCLVPFGLGGSVELEWEKNHERRRVRPGTSLHSSKGRVIYLYFSVNLLLCVPHFEDVLV